MERITCEEDLKTGSSSEEIPPLHREASKGKCSSMELQNKLNLYPQYVDAVVEKVKVS